MTEKSYSENNKLILEHVISRLIGDDGIEVLENQCSGSSANPMSSSTAFSCAYIREAIFVGDLHCREDVIRPAIDSSNRDDFIFDRRLSELVPIDERLLEGVTAFAALPENEWSLVITECFLAHITPSCNRRRLEKADNAHRY